MLREALKDAGAELAGVVGIVDFGDVRWVWLSKKVYWWIESSCSKPWIKLVRVVTAPVCGQS